MRGNGGVTRSNSTASYSVSPVNNYELIQKQKGRICRVCDAKFTTLKNFTIFAEQMTSQDDLIEIWCNQLHDIQKEGRRFEEINAGLKREIEKARTRMDQLESEELQSNTETTDKKKQMVEEQKRLKQQLQEAQDQEEKLNEQNDECDDEIERAERELDQEEAVLLDTKRRLREVNNHIMEVTRSFVDRDNVVDSILEFAGSNHGGRAGISDSLGMEFGPRGGGQIGLSQREQQNYFNVE